MPVIPGGPGEATKLGLNGLLRNDGLVETLMITDVDKDGRCVTTSPAALKSNCHLEPMTSFIARGINHPADGDQSLLSLNLMTCWLIPSVEAHNHQVSPGLHFGTLSQGFHQAVQLSSAQPHKVGSERDDPHTGHGSPAPPVSHPIRLPCSFVL